MACTGQILILKVNKSLNLPLHILDRQTLHDKWHSITGLQQSRSSTSSGFNCLRNGSTCWIWKRWRTFTLHYRSGVLWLTQRLSLLLTDKSEATKCLTRNRKEKSASSIGSHRLTGLSFQFMRGKSLGGHSNFVLITSTSQRLLSDEKWRWGGSSSLTMEAADSSQTSTSLYQQRRRHVHEACNLQ